MRKDIQELLKNRPSWILSNDEEYQLLLKGQDYAYQTGNRPAVEEFTLLMQKRRAALLDDT
jgi:hypothetical protein